MNPQKGRICLECKHCQVSPGDYGYSEYTPSSDFEFYCLKGHRFGSSLNELNNHEANKIKMIQDLRMAEICRDFVLEVV